MEKSIPINIDPVKRKVLYIRITDLSTDIDIYYCKVTRCRQLVVSRQHRRKIDSIHAINVDRSVWKGSFVRTTDIYCNKMYIPRYIVDNWINEGRSTVLNIRKMAVIGEWGSAASARNRFRPRSSRYRRYRVEPSRGGEDMRAPSANPRQYIREDRESPSLSPPSRVCKSRAHKN